MHAATRSDVDAVILVGGKGTRLRPLTLSAPKPMLPTAGVPFLTHLLSQIRAAGVRHVILGTSYQAEVFSEHFGSGAALDLEIDYVVEDEPLGTGGAIGNVAHLLRGDNVLICNGDILSGVDLGALIDQHVETGSDVTLHLTTVPDPRAFGCVPTDADGRVTAFLEKDPNPVTNQINAGTYVFTRKVAESIPTGRPVSVERETFPELLAGGALVTGFLDDSYWRDLGKPSDFVEGSADLVRGVAPTHALPAEPGECLILPGGEIAASAVVARGSTVGERCVIHEDARVTGSVLFDGVHVGAGSLVRSSVIGRGVFIGAGTVIEDAVIGDGAVIGAGNELRAGIRIWPGAHVEDGSLRFSADV